MSAPERPGLSRGAARIFSATLALLRERGYAGLTIEGVAARSGIHKTTIYRWWPSKGALLRTALAGVKELDGHPPDTGTLQGDLEELLHLVCSVLAGKESGPIAVATLGAVTASDEMADFVRGFLQDRTERVRIVFDRAVRRGELDPTVDPTLLIDLLIGAAWVRAVFRGATVDNEFVRQAVSMVVSDAQAPGLRRDPLRPTSYG